MGVGLSKESGCLVVGQPSAVGVMAKAQIPCVSLSLVLKGRATCRRGGIGNDQDLMEHCCILVHTAKACAATQLATVLAAWFHWYGRLDLQTAIQVKSDNSS